MSLTESRRDLRTWATGNHHMAQVKPSHGTARAIIWHSSSHHMACSTSRVLSMQRHPRDSPRDQGHQKAHQEEAAGDCKLGLLPGLLSASALLTAVAACAHHSPEAPPSSAMLPLCKRNIFVGCFVVTLAKVCKDLATKLTYWESDRCFRCLIIADALGT